jgi:hypothetical protein
MKHKYDPRNVRKFFAELTSNQGTTGQTSKWHRIMPRTIVKYFGNSPFRSHPTGMAFEEMLVTIVAKHWMNAPRKIQVLVPGPQ